MIRVMTSQDGSGEEIRDEMRALLGSTDGLGLMHESVNSHNDKDWTRSWFGWANGVFGEMVLGLEERWPELLGESFQN